MDFIEIALEKLRKEKLEIDKSFETHRNDTNTMFDELIDKLKSMIR